MTERKTKQKKRANKAKELPPIERQEKILDAALECIEEVGVFNTNSQTVMKKLGLSQPAFFYYFKNQQSFHLALVKHVVSKIRAARERASLAKREQTNWDRTFAFLHGNLRWLHGNPSNADILFQGFLRCAQDPALISAVTTTLRGGEEALTNLIATGVMDGEFKPQLPGRVVAQILHRALLGYIIDVHCFQANDKEYEAAEKKLVQLARLLLGLPEL